MAKEIERKYLVCSPDYKQLASSHIDIEQFYLSTDPKATVRIRIAGDMAYLTVKGRNDGCTRDEWEYAIPVDDAREMARLASAMPMRKTRWIVDAECHKWEVDEFHGHLEGLTVAEVELTCADIHPTLPGFIGREVTGDPRYYNSMLASGAEIPPSA